MPKMKTHRGAAKRFKATGTGKLMRRKQGLRHILTKKATDRKHVLGQATEVSAVDVPRVKRMLPYC